MCRKKHKSIQVEKRIGGMKDTVFNLFNKFIFFFCCEGALTTRANMMSTGNSFKWIKHLTHTICNIVLAAGNVPKTLLIKIRKKLDQ